MNVSFSLSQYFLDFTKHSICYLLEVQVQYHCNNANLSNSIYKEKYKQHFTGNKLYFDISFIQQLECSEAVLIQRLWCFPNRIRIEHRSIICIHVIARQWQQMSTHRMKCQIQCGAISNAYWQHWSQRRMRRHGTLFIWHLKVWFQYCCYIPVFYVSQHENPCATRVAGECELDIFSYIKLQCLWIVVYGVEWESLMKISVGICCDLHTTSNACVFNRYSKQIWRCAQFNKRS